MILDEISEKNQKRVFYFTFLILPCAILFSILIHPILVAILFLIFGICVACTFIFAGSSDFD